MKRLSSALACLVLAGCALFNSPPSEAATVTVSWTNPTTNMDNSAIPTDGTQAGSLSAWVVEYGTCAAGGSFGVKAGEVLRPRAAGGPELTSAVLNLNPSTVCVRVLVRNTYNETSDPSNVVSHVVPAPRPRPATNVTAVTG
jgi:hypothetical protein